MLSELSSEDTAPQQRVLVVDDDRDFAEGMYNFLVVEGFDVQVAHSAKEALEAIEKFDAQVAILDYRLGDTIGLDLVVPLKQCRPDIQCLLATAHADMDSAVKALRHGIYDFFSKPLNTDELLATLRRCFEKIRLARAERMVEEAQWEAEKMRAVAHMAGGVSHHFNNLLMIMLANAERLKLCVRNDNYALTLTEELEQAIGRAAELNQNLQTYTRQRISRPKAVGVDSMVSEVVDALRPEFGGLIRAEIAIESDISAVYVDPVQFRLVLLGIMRNAVEAMPNGGKLTVEAGGGEFPETVMPEDSEHGKRSYVVLAIADNGTGMSPEVARRVFEPFFSQQGLGDKIGLGLSTAYGFAMQSGGQITVDSQEGRGTTVKLYLPPSQARDRRDGSA